MSKTILPRRSHEPIRLTAPGAKDVMITIKSMSDGIALIEIESPPEIQIESVIVKKAEVDLFDELSDGDKRQLNSFMCQ